jgi:uncharacterized membrane protein
VSGTRTPLPFRYIIAAFLLFAILFLIVFWKTIMLALIGGLGFRYLYRQAFPKCHHRA